MSRVIRRWGRGGGREVNGLLGEQSPGWGRWMMDSALHLHDLALPL